MYIRSNRNRMHILVNNKIVAMIQPVVTNDGAIYTAGVFKLNAGDVITLKVNIHTIRVYMSIFHCYVGAYLI